MKSERRHELQQNDLAAYLNRINKVVEPYTRVIAVAVGVIAVGAIALAFYNTQRSGERSDATLFLIQASASRDAEVLLDVSEKYPDTAAGAWARLYQGKEYLTQGIEALYSDRNNAEELLNDATAAFKTAISKGRNDKLLRSRAHFGIARAAESLGNIDDAIAAYEKVVEVNESEAMVKKANERIDTLSNPQTKEFLAWFADQDFSPSDPSLPPSLPGGAALPEIPDFDLPIFDATSVGDGDDEMDLDDRPGGIELPKENVAPEVEGEVGNAGTGETETSNDENGETETDAGSEDPTPETPSEPDENESQPTP